jgi:hypothetical protein
MNNWLINLLYDLKDGEFLIIPIIVLLFLVWKSKKDYFKELLISYNYLTLFTLIIFLITYVIELYLAWSNTSKYEYDIFFKYRISGPYAWSYWLYYIINSLCTGLLLFKRWRHSPLFSIILYFFTSFGLWFERLIIMLTSFYRDYLPSSWSNYSGNYTGAFLNIIYFLLSLFIITSVREHLKKNRTAKNS